MTAHNSYLLVAAELGIVGMFLFVGMILVTLVQWVVFQRWLPSRIQGWQDGR